MLKNPLNSPKGLDHICAVVIQIPQLAIVALVSPPEWVVPGDLILLELCANSPALQIHANKNLIFKIIGKEYYNTLS